MNRMMASEGEILNLTLNLRTFVLDSIGDEDLGRNLGGRTQTLGELLNELADWQKSYAASFQSFKLEFTPVGHKAHTVAELKALFARLDAELKAGLEALSDADLDKPVDRGGWHMPVTGQFHTFRETVLIFAAKASVYLRAWGKPFGEQFEHWIA